MRGQIPSLRISLLALIFASTTLSATLADDTHANLANEKADASSMISEEVSNTLWILLGRNESVNSLVEAAVSAVFDSYQVRFLTPADLSAINWAEDLDVAITIGQESCLEALKSGFDGRIFCTLLTEDQFRQLRSQHNQTQSATTAVVIDQPVARQAKVANHIFPSLDRFSTFLLSPGNVSINSDVVVANTFPFNENRGLSQQLDIALTNHDALIATANPSIYNAGTHSTILLTAYGYEKPVIGYSRAYVKAGALLTCYSTPLHIMSQIRGLLDKDPGQISQLGTLIYPSTFSIEVNISVARSLGLSTDRWTTPEKTYSDADFIP